MSSIANEEDLFQYLISEFKFPDLYSYDWKGLEQHFYYDSMERVPKKLVILGSNKMRQHNEQMFTQLLRILEEQKELVLEWQDA